MAASNGMTFVQTFVEKRLFAPAAECNRLLTELGHVNACTNKKMSKRDVQIAVKTRSTSCEVGGFHSTDVDDSGLQERYTAYRPFRLESRHFLPAFYYSYIAVCSYSWHVVHPCEIK
jgi:hypothetical protein